jgi:hypothetical protein
LADLAGAIDGALKGALGQKQRAHLAQVVIDDRLAADKAERLDQLPDPDARQLRVLAKQPWISSLNGSSLDGRSGQRKPGGASERSATLIVLRARPVRRTSSLIETPRMKCSRRSSAQRSTSSTTLLSWSRWQ